MTLVDKLVREIEQEIHNIVDERTRVEDSIKLANVTIEKLNDREKEARKIYKQLRKQQPTRTSTDVAPILKEPIPATNNGSKPSGPDYDGTVEVLSEQDSFTLTEFMELAAVSRGAARERIKRLRAEKTITVISQGVRGEKDSTKYKVTK